MRLKPLTLVPLLSLAAASLAAQQPSGKENKPTTTLAPGDAGPRKPQARAAHKPAQSPAGAKLSVILIDEAYLTSNQHPCYTVRSYSYSQTDPATGRVTPNGTSTCQPGRNLHRKDATDSTQQRPAQK